jgi:hypothetical protein
MVLEDQILLNFLENSAKEASEEIRSKGLLSEKNAIPLMLKSQFNHIAHLDAKMVTRDEFLTQIKEINSKFDLMHSKFNHMQWFMSMGFAFLSVFIAVLKFF